MTSVTAFRHVPKPIIGMVSFVNDREFLALEEGLDWLETEGFVVERVDPATDPRGVAAHPVAQQLLSSGDHGLPLVLVDEAVALQGEFPSRAQLARAVGHARCKGGRTDRPTA